METKGRPQKGKIYKWTDKNSIECVGIAYYHKQTEDLVAVGYIALNKVDSKFRETGENFIRKESDCIFIGFKD